MKTDEQKKNLQKQAKGIARFFKIEFTLSIFGQVIIHWVYPPQEEE